jgi:hypothetical protein
MFDIDRGGYIGNIPRSSSEGEEETGYPKELWN